MKVGGLSDGRRWLLKASLAVCAAMLVGVLIRSGAAEAALEHPYIGTIAKNKKGVSDEVCGVSIDPGSGEIAVSDPGVEGVEVFDRTGAFLRKISSVQYVEEETVTEKAEREEKEKKEIEKGKTPKEPSAKFEKEELEEFCSTAENDRSATLYIADGGEHAVFPFNREGKQIFATNKEGKRIAGAEITGAETPAGEFGEELHVAIDQGTGQLYVSDRENEAVDVFSEAGRYERQLAFPGRAGEERLLTGPIAVDQATGEVYVGAQGQAFDEAENEGFGFVYVFDSAGAFLREISGHPAGAFSGFGAEVEPMLTGLAVGPEGNLYASDAARRTVFEFDRSGDFIGSIAGTPAGGFSEPFGVALDQAGDLYVVDRTEERNRERGRAELGLEPLPGALDEFGPATSAISPTIESESVAEVAATHAALDAVIDPTGIETSYHFELCQAASCVDVPALPGASVGSGEAPRAVSQPVAGLSANTAYTYRVVLAYGAGAASTVLGATESFTTATEGTSVQLPDGRAWELVSSPEKRGAGLESIPREGGLIQASESGDALTYISLAPDEANPEGNRVPTFDQLLSKRGEDESGAPSWSSKDITLPGEAASGAITGNGKQEYRFFTEDLEASLVEPLGLGPRAQPPLSPPALPKEEQERTIYTRRTEGCTAPPSTCYQSVVNAANDVAHSSYGGSEGARKAIEFVSATPSLSHVVFDSLVPLTEDKVEAEANIYEWSPTRPNGAPATPAEQLQLVNILPAPAPGMAGEATPGAAELGDNHVTRHALSSDGTKAIFSAEGHLYVRDMVAGETVQVDTPNFAGGSSGTAVFQTASSDGTKIFFTDEGKLTENATVTEKSRNLFEFDLDTRTLTDLSIDPSFKQTAEGSSVLGLVPGASEDGSMVYFVANGVLTSAPNPSGETAAPGHCVARSNEEEAVAGATCNLYLERGAAEGEAPTFIGRLSAGDASDWQDENGNLAYMTSRVSPDGRYFAFMSQRSLTGYDNRDTAPAAHEARDEEVFLYDSAGDGSLTCASCDASGARPSGVFDGGSSVRSEEGLGLLTDRIETWEGKWLAGALPGWTASEGQTASYQSRYLSDSGRLFFNTTEPLAAADTNGMMDVYEYEPNGIGSCGSASGCAALISSGSSDRESAFLDASASGDDVFFMTSAALVSTDHDSGFDVYDARVCGTSGCVIAPGTTSTSCDSTAECRPSSTSGPIPSFGSPASATTPSGGNLAAGSGVLPSKAAVKPTPKKPTRAQLLAKALKTCKKLKKKQARAACERTARKKYGPKKKAKQRAPVKKGKK
jgi:hypothetical protein